MVYPWALRYIYVSALYQSRSRGGEKRGTKAHRRRAGDRPLFAPSPGSDKAVFDREADGGGPVLDLQLGVNALQMGANRVRAEIQPLRHLAIREAGSGKAQHFSLPLREPA